MRFLTIAVGIIFGAILFYWMFPIPVHEGLPDDLEQFQTWEEAFYYIEDRVGAGDHSFSFIVEDTITEGVSESYPVFLQIKSERIGE